jgi:hypothetical protein
MDIEYIHTGFFNERLPLPLQRFGIDKYPHDALSWENTERKTSDWQDEQEAGMH